MAKNNWEICDMNGVIHSGTQEEMQTAWMVMTGNVAQLSGLQTRREELEKEWAWPHKGDLKLVEVHNVWNG